MLDKMLYKFILQAFSQSSVVNLVDVIVQPAHGHGVILLRHDDEGRDVVHHLLGAFQRVISSQNCHDLFVCFFFLRLQSQEGHFEVNEELFYRLLHPVVHVLIHQMG